MSGQRVVVIGGGAAGLMAAGRAAEQGADVVLLEKMDRPGKKLLITGRTRCNVTNTKPLEAFLGMYGPQGQFLRNAFHRYFRDDLLALLGRYGVETKVERDPLRGLVVIGGRVFPASDDARDVVRALERYLADSGAELRTGVRVTGIQVEHGRVCGVETDVGAFPAGAVVLATGGASYPATGSTGDGFRMAAALGHTIVRLRPALVPLVVREAGLARRMQGVSLSNVRLTVWQCPADGIDPASAPTRDIGRGRGGSRPRPPVIESRTGDLMFTHCGLGGPVTLLVSLAAVDARQRGSVSVSLDLEPERDMRQLERHLQEFFNRHSRRRYRGLLSGLLPRKMVEPFVELTGIPPDKPGHHITAEERGRLARLLKAFRFNVQGPLSMAAAIVTAGGVSLREIDPRTMASRLVTGLFFAGEVMDLDADTGGYNLQAAFSTGYVAGEQAAACAIRLHTGRKTGES